MNGARRAGVLVLLVGLLAGCTGAATEPAPTGPATGPATELAAEPASPLTTCEDLATPADAAPAIGLPPLTLPCFTGGEPFALRDLRGPAVVNLWASWCDPCRDELPILQEYAEQVAGEVRVLGVVTLDRASAAASLAEDQGITFPALDDPDGVLFHTAGLAGLPATLYLDAAGELAYYHQGPLDQDTFAEQVTEHLGLAG